MPKVPDKKMKRLFYRRAFWEGQKKDGALEDFISECHKKFTSTSDRTFKGLYGTEIQCAKYEYKKNVGIFMQIASYVPGQSTSVINNASAQTTESPVSEVEAPVGNDFLDGDIFFFINGNNIILLQSGARDTVALHYLNQMLIKNSFEHISSTLEFQKIANEDKVQMIKNEGVKSIELNASLYEASLMYADKKKQDQKIKVTKIMEIKGIIAEHIRQVFAKDESLNSISEKENVNIKLSISFDGREARKHKKDPTFGELGRSRLQKCSEKIVQEDMEESDGFTIITGDGNQIKTDEIVVSDKFQIKTLGISLFPSHAFQRLEEYFYQLKDRGILTK